MSLLPSARVVNGKGKPRIIVKNGSGYTSKGSLTYAVDGVTEANSTPLSIVDVSSDGVTSTWIEVGSGHAIEVNDIIVIAENGSTPSINGDHVVVAVTTTHVKIDDYVTSPASDGTLYRSADPEKNGLLAGMYILSTAADAGFGAGITTGVITGFDNGKILIDEWSDGTPDNSEDFIVDGIAIDLPMCNRLTETFTPDVRINKRRDKTKTRRDYGYEYTATLDYSSYASGDMLASLQSLFGAGGEDEIVLIPRVDAPEFSYVVFLDPNASTSFSMIGDGQGHDGFILQFIGQHNVAGLPVFDFYDLPELL